MSSSISIQHNSQISVLNGLRGFAALYVLIHHARLLLAQPFKLGLAIVPEQFALLDKILVYFFGFFKFGHEAVIIFFVLSGFVIHLKQSQLNFNISKFSTKKFIIKRIIRLYPTLIAAMLLCVLLDTYSYIYFKDTDILNKYSIIQFIQNIALIPNISDWGNNYPLWSLKHEWIFYLLYPILLNINSKNKFLSLLIVGSSFLLYLFKIKIPILENVAYTILIWYLGVILAELYNKQNKLLKKITPLFMLPIIFYPLLDRNDVNIFPILDLIFGLFTMGLISFLLFNKIKIANNFFNLFNQIGNYSFSLYLLHWPIQVFLQSIILNQSANRTLPYHQWFIILGIIISFIFAYLIYLISEKPVLKYLKSYSNN